MLSSIPASASVFYILGVAALQAASWGCLLVVLTLPGLHFLQCYPQAESLKYKLLGGLAVRRACYGVLRFIMESGAKGAEVGIRVLLRQAVNALFLVRGEGGWSLMRTWWMMMPNTRGNLATRHRSAR